jgi:hypothetical protein
LRSERVPSWREPGHQAHQRVGRLARPERCGDVLAVQGDSERAIIVPLLEADLNQHVATADAVGARRKRPDAKLGPVVVGNCTDGHAQQQTRRAQHSLQHVCFSQYTVGGWKRGLPLVT